MENKKNNYCTCLYYSANALARKITKMAEEAFATTGLAPSYALLMMSISKNPGLHPMELSEIMMLTPSTVTRLIEKLELKGLVKRKNEGKFTYVQPTSEGKKLTFKIEKAWHRLYMEYTEILGEKNAKELTSQIFEAVEKLES
ncbi:MAG: MarR family transcriptional regulator [Melioribacteraceae bacterium]|nr:MarR family transcriptional regulator [Melioribacteraceae bacterium]